MSGKGDSPRPYKPTVFGENYDRIFRGGRWSAPIAHDPLRGEFGTVVELDGVIRPAGRPLTPGTVREYRSDCCGSPILGRGVCQFCRRKCTPVLTPIYP